jgi:undecaprenyl diphosphate synthase
MNKEPGVSAHPLKHVAIIMDGNNRWAKQRGLAGIAGHRAGAERIRGLLPHARQQGIQTVSLFAFSSENWNRPALEVRGLMSLFSSYLKQEAKVLRDDKIRLKIIGNRERFSQRLNQQIDKAEKLTENGELNLHIYVDYGGRWEIAEAARELAKSVIAGELSIDQISADNLDVYFTADGATPPDLCIRTAGEQRISNFMLWQMAYAELYFTDCYWPDFDENVFQQAIEDYYSRQRRFGAREPENELANKN